MTLHFGDRVPADGTLRCERCGHGIALLGGDTVPRCYCGGEAFDHRATPCEAGTPRPAKPSEGTAAYTDPPRWPSR
jgi:hypothetical protein